MYIILTILINKTRITIICLPLLNSRKGIIVSHRFRVKIKREKIILYSHAELNQCSEQKRKDCEENSKAKLTINVEKKSTKCAKVV